MQLHPLWDVRIEILCTFAVLAALEICVLSVRFGEVYEPEAIVSTALMWLVEQVARLGSLALRLAAFTLAHRMSPFALELELWSWLLGYIAVDFIYYWKHRMLHVTELGWALHEPHHSSHRLNLLAALRLGWVQRVLDDFAYLPLALLGFPPLALLLLIELDHGQQFWCHTRTIGRVSALDPWLNTPSNHRVHHARDRALTDSNFGATFMVWDRLFGTYRAEPAGSSLAYGTGGYAGNNPLKVQLLPLARYLSARRRRTIHRAT